MNSKSFERTRAILAETLPLMDQHREEIEAAIARNMAREGPHDPSPERMAIKSGAILEMLIGHARQIVENGAASDLAETRRRHSVLALGSEHYSMVGDALNPIIRDVLGAHATPAMLAAWGDTYWTIVRMLFEKPVRLAA